MTKLPPEARVLIEQLHRIYPHRCPRFTDAEREIWAYAGKRELIDSLIALCEQSRVKLNLSADPYEEDEEE